LTPKKIAGPEDTGEARCERASRSLRNSKTSAFAGVFLFRREWGENPWVRFERKRKGDRAKRDQAFRPGGFLSRSPSHSLRNDFGKGEMRFMAVHLSNLFTSYLAPVVQEEPAPYPPPMPAPKSEWITPSEQMLKLLSLNEIHFSKNKPSLFHDEVDDIVERVRLQEPKITAWYLALKRLNAMPLKIPPLPNHIRQILRNKCPILRDQKKADGTFYTVGDTHHLFLIPQELRSLKQLEGQVVKPYRNKWHGTRLKLCGRENDLTIDYLGFSEKESNQLANQPFAESQWVMAFDRTLGQKVPWYLVDEPSKVLQRFTDDIKKESFIQYKIPTLQQSYVTRLFHYVLSGKSLYQDVPVIVEEPDLEEPAMILQVVGKSVFAGKWALYEEEDRIGVSILRQL